MIEKLRLFCLKYIYILILALVFIAGTMYLFLSYSYGYDNRLSLSHQWDYSIVSDKDEQNVFSSSFKNWAKLDKLPFEGSLEKDSSLWLRFKIPQGYWKNPSIYFENIYGNYIKVYLESKEIYSYERSFLDFNNLVMVLPLGQEYKGKSIIMKVISQDNKIGPTGKYKIAELDDLMPLLFMKDILSLVLGGGLVFFGLIVFLFTMFLKNIQRKLSIPLGILLIAFGFIITTDMSFFYLVFPDLAPIKGELILVAILLSFSSLLYFVIQVLAYKKSSIFVRIWQITSICFLLYIMNKISGLNIILLERIAGISIIAEILTIVVIAAKNIFSKNTYGKIFSLGFFIFSYSIISELVYEFIVQAQQPDTLWKYGSICFIICLVIILGKRAAEDFNKVFIYSRELVTKNAQLDKMSKDLRVSNENLEKLNESLEFRINERTIELENTNTELSNINEELIATMEQLKETQGHLVQSEKMAALGQLVAGVAHEVNTPLGVIQAAITNAYEYLKQIYISLPDTVKVLDDNDQKLFFKLVEKSVKTNAEYTMKEERTLKSKLISTLEEKKISDADSIADNLIDMRIYDGVDEYMPLLKSQENNSIFKNAYNLSALQRNLDNIGLAVKQASKIVFALKNYSRKEQEGEQKTETDIVSGIDMVLTLYENKTRQNVQIIKNYSNIPKISCNADEMYQVWTNLISNALHAMEYKGVLEIDVYEEINNIIVKITDSGKGIPIDIQDKIFQPFFTTKPEGEGTGLGLDIVSKIIKKHNGSIELVSHPKKTVFTVILPARQTNTI